MRQLLTIDANIEPQMERRLKVSTSTMELEMSDRPQPRFSYYEVSTHLRTKKRLSLLYHELEEERVERFREAESRKYSLRKIVPRGKVGDSHSFNSRMSRCAFSYLSRCLRLKLTRSSPRLARNRSSRCCFQRRFPSLRFPHSQSNHRPLLHSRELFHSNLREI